MDGCMQGYVNRWIYNDDDDDDDDNDECFDECL
jgi:hypothetical protein